MKVHTRSVLLSAVAAASSSIVPVVKADNPSFIAINAPQGLAGNQNYYPLGIDFTVNATVTVTALGIFDAGGDGIAATGTDPYSNMTVPTTLTADLYQVDRSQVANGGLPTGTLLAQQTFTNAAPGTLGTNSDFRFITLSTPITLTAGNTYDIAGYGFNSNNEENNTGAGQQTSSGGGTVNYLGSFYGDSASNDPNGGLPPENADSSIVKYAAASFMFTPSVLLTRTWTGGINANWSTGTNWAEGSPPNNGTPLIFQTPNNQPMNNDLSALSVAGMTFNTGGFTINGNALTNTGTIENQAGSNTINTALTLSGGSGNTVQVDAGTLTLAGVVTTSGTNLSKTGAGTLVLSGANNLSGGIIVNSGTVQMSDVSDGSTSNIGAGVQGMATAYLAIYGGTVEVTGTGTQTTDRNIYTDPSSAATLTLQIDNAATTVVSTGEMRSNGTLAADLIKTGAGTLALEGKDPFFATTGGDRAYNFVSVQQGTLLLGRSVGSAVDGVDGIATGATVKVVADTSNGGATATSTQIFVDAAGAYGAGPLASNPGLLSITGGTFDLNGSSQTINRLNSVVAGSVVTNSATGTTSTLTIGAPNLNGNAAGVYAGQINDGAGIVALVKTGDATVATLSGTNSYSGGTTVSAGMLIASSTTALPNTGAVSVGATGTLQLAAPGFGTSTIGALSITSGGEVDVTKNILLTSSSASSVRSLIKSGGFVSTTATAAEGIGYGTNGSKTEIRATLLGDADLDGSVSINDFNTLAANFGTPSGATWAQGDFDYDGSVSINDFNALAANFGVTLSATGSAERSMVDWAPFIAFAEAHNDLTAFQAATGVPEPTSLAVLGVAAAFGLRRRRAV